MKFNKGEIMRRKMKNKQLRKVTLKFWNNMLVLAVFAFLLVGSVSAAQTSLNSPDSTDETIDYSSDDVQLTLSNAEAVKAYNVICLREPNALVKSCDKLSLAINSDYEIESTYNVKTKYGDAKVSVISHVTPESGRVLTLSKQAILANNDVINEKEDELLVLNNGELTAISVSDKENAQKMLVNAVEPLVEKKTLERPVLTAKKEFVVMADKPLDISVERELISTDDFKFYVIKSDDVSKLTLDSSVIKICEAKPDLLKKFVDYSKEVLKDVSELKIRELKLKKTTYDCVELPQLKAYMKEDGWDALPGQKSPYQRFVTPDNSYIKQLSVGKTVKEIFEMAVDWNWVSDKVLFGRTEKWILPNEFLSDTPNYKRNPSPGYAVSDCSEQANTLVSLLRASGVPAEDVRVVLGKVDFDGSVGGHAWVQIKEKGRWMVLDPTCGPYYDEEENRIIQRNGVNYGYWQYHNYPEVEVWCYYNDVYYTTENEEVAEGWSNQYNVFIEAEMFAGFLFEESFNMVFVYVIVAAVAVFSLATISRKKQNNTGNK